MHLLHERHYRGGSTRRGHRKEASSITNDVIKHGNSSLGQLRVIVQQGAIQIAHIERSVVFLFGHVRFRIQFTIACRPLSTNLRFSPRSS